MDSNSKSPVFFDNVSSRVIDDGNYEYEYTYQDGASVPLTLSNLPRNTNFTYKVFSNGVQKASGSFRTLQ